MIEAVTAYWGLDWIALVLGLTGTYMITSVNRWGFIVAGAGCICGFAVALMSGQLGFVVYNALLLAMMLRGFSTMAPVRHFDPAE